MGSTSMETEVKNKHSGCYLQNLEREELILDGINL